MFLQIIIFTAILVGVGLIIFSLIMFNSNNKNSSFGYFEADNTVKAIESSIEEMDKTMEEFNKVAKAAFDEIDQKYQELLFLYTLIDEKKNAIADLYSSTTPASNGSIKPELKTDFTITNNTTISSPKQKDILRLQNQGKSVSEIAKQLNIGQGEVKLILELGKAR